MLFELSSIHRGMRNLITDYPLAFALPAGMLQPSRGDILLNGRSVALEPGAVQAARLGLCPQRNVLYDALTVHEHLALFAAIRGMPGGLASMAPLYLLLIVHLQGHITQAGGQTQNGNGA